MRKGRKYNQEETIDKYFNALINIRQEMLIDKKKRVKYYNEKYQLNANLITWLLKKQIIIKDNYNNYYWNDKIHITKELINLYLKDTSKMNILRKNKIQPEIQFDMPSSPRVKKPKTRTKIVRVQEPVNNPTQAKEYGLIRRFLKWIY